jgi:hypothetical protein
MSPPLTLRAARPEQYAGFPFLVFVTAPLLVAAVDTAWWLAMAWLVGAWLLTR